MRYPAKSGSLLPVQVNVAPQTVPDHNTMIPAMALPQFIRMLLSPFSSIAQTTPGESYCSCTGVYAGLFNGLGHPSSLLAVFSLQRIATPRRRDHKVNDSTHHFRHRKTYAVGGEEWLLLKAVE
jgi:hypothetical protein